MLAHNLKAMLEIVPELKEHIKEANFEEAFPMDNKDGALASFIRCRYLTKVAGKGVDRDMLAKADKAVQLYGIEKMARDFEAKIDAHVEMVKQATIAAAYEITPAARAAQFEGNLTFIFDLEKVAADAEALNDTDKEATSDNIKLYAGDAYFNKAAAVCYLEARAHYTGKEVFSKVATIVNNSMGDSPTKQAIRDVCHTVTRLDKQAGLNAKGFNFYKEALLVKVADISRVLTINLAGQKIPHEKIARFGSNAVSFVLGEDVGSALTGNPQEDKAVLEALPLDSQRLLSNVIKTR